MRAYPAPTTSRATVLGVWFEACPCPDTASIPTGSLRHASAWQIPTSKRTPKHWPAKTVNLVCHPHQPHPSSQDRFNRSKGSGGEPPGRGAVSCPLALLAKRSRVQRATLTPWFLSPWPSAHSPFGYLIHQINKS